MIENDLRTRLQMGIHTLNSGDISPGDIERKQIYIRLHPVGGNVYAL